MTLTAETSTRRWGPAAAVAITLVVTVIISLINACVPVLAPKIAADRGWNVALITFYAPTVCVASLCINFLAPFLLRRLGGMGLGLVCVAFSAAGLLFLLSDGFWLLTGAPLAIGLATGALNPASAQILGPRTTPQNSGLIMSIKQTGVPLGGVLAGALVPLLVLYWGWQAAVVDLALASAAAGVLLLPAVGWLNADARSLPITKYRPLEPIRRLLALPGMLRLLVAALAFVSMQLSLRSFFTVYLVDQLGFDLTTAGLAFGASQAAGIVGQIGWAVMSDRLLPARAVMAIVGVLMSAGAALTAVFTSNWPVAGIVVVAVVYGVSAAGFIPVVLGEVMRRSPPGQAGALMSGANLFILSGVLVGPLIFGAVLAVASYAAAFVALAAGTLAASILVALPPGPSRPDVSQGDHSASRSGQ
ncbi:MFS transporter [uncultured Bradyrhizobium sp.]|uniref:MFS transporter n=1 Tax=uncultured Bradyrhizobium sp. TaxID=199684 RepID=UPI0035CBB875